jgi:hypothetical protein
MKRRFDKKGKLPDRKAHKLTQFKECKSSTASNESEVNQQACYEKVRGVSAASWDGIAYIYILVNLVWILYIQVSNILEEFFHARSFMWPTFAGNGFDYAN